MTLFNYRHKWTNNKNLFKCLDRMIDGSKRGYIVMIKTPLKPLFKDKKLRL